MKRLLAFLMVALLPTLSHAAYPNDCLGQLQYPTINASQNDYVYPGKEGEVEKSCVILISPSTVVDLTGIGWQAPGALRYLVNSGAKDGAATITLKHESTSSTAKYRFYLGQDIVLGGGDAATIFYDWTLQRWRVLSVAAVYSPVLTNATIGAATIASLGVTGDAAAATFSTTTANGASWTRQSASESITLSTSGATTDSVADLLPANSVITAVVCRVTTTITTATDWGISDPTTTLRFSAVNATMTAGATIVGLKHMFGVVSTTATGPTQAAAAKLRITTTGTPGAGVVRCTVFSEVFVAPTS